MKKILWISRHQMTDAQFDDLRRCAQDEIELTVWDETVKDLHVLLPLVERADMIAAVLPLDLMAQLVRVAGDKPVLRAVNRRIPTGAVTTLPDGRCEAEYAFEHMCWQRIIRIDVETQCL